MYILSGPWLYEEKVNPVNLSIVYLVEHHEESLFIFAYTERKLWKGQLNTSKNLRLETHEEAKIKGQKKR